MIKYLRYFYYLFYRPKIFFSKKSYSLLGEDIFLKKYFLKQKKGFYVDVGCYHPISGNNTYLLYKKGWNGINFDISEFSIELFNFYRKKDKNIFCGISNKKGSKKIYYRKKINMLNTTSKKLAKIHFRNGFEEKIIGASSLNSIINNSKFKKNKIDFLNIDVEGSELDVLKSLNFKKFKPKLICIEIHNHEEMYNEDLGYLKRNAVYKFLIKKGYKIFWNKGFSFIFR